MAENMPCNSLPMAYVFIESPALLIILKTCNKTDIPPQPSKKAVKIKLIENFLLEMLEIEFIPLVISKNPLINGEAKTESILKTDNIGERTVEKADNIPLDFNIDITLEKITTKPPINKIVEMLFVILSDNTLPKLEKVTVVCLEVAY